ncbi:caspase family protein [Neolewinella litorea]|uniref:Peptidase C14 caspase domain-containing protein n=1 Tax=Neolewinella litorea TaxID=2562452 RepID=A0A4S4N5I0_9BACT|nr:caspase family protein [Neolewinella litorea]THH34346.1 hypothetical protein E4021_17745 [Neolewinella litorea]
MIKAINLAIVTILVQIGCITAQKYDLFYLSMGSPVYSNLGNLDAAEVGATEMSNLFDELGAVDGLKVITDVSHPMTDKLINKSLNGLVKLIRKSRSSNPLVIFYYAGHGFTSGLSKGLYIPPTDFDIDNTKDYDYMDWLENTISPLQVKEFLDEQNLDYILMFDSCQEGELVDDQVLDSYVIDNLGLETLDTLMRQTYEILIAYNLMVGDNPVILSCEPGNIVSTEPYNFGNGTVDTAPLCRRAHIVLKRELVGESVSVKKFMQTLLNHELDPSTNSLFTAWKYGEKNDKTIGIIR